jgi:hypothetical protein
MLWLSRRVLWIETVCNNPGCKLAKRIAGAFLIPPLILYNLLLEGFIRLQELAITRLNVKNLGLQIKDGTRKFDTDCIRFDLGACVQKSLGYVGYVSHGGDVCGDHSHGNSSTNVRCAPTGAVEMKLK